MSQILASFILLGVYTALCMCRPSDATIGSAVWQFLNRATLKVRHSSPCQPMRIRRKFDLTSLSSFLETLLCLFKVHNLPDGL
jgi:hypothetical protein